MKQNNVTGVVVGSLNMDLVVTGENIPKPGETLSANHFTTIPGGKGANQAVACANLGANIRMVGRVGNDNFGKELKESLSLHNIDDSFVLVDKEASTGVALISVDKYGENSISAVYGANMSFPEEQFKVAKESLKGADFLLLQNEVPLELNISIAKYAKSKNIPVFWDPAPSNDESIGIMEFCSYLTPNSIEAEKITGLNIKTPEQAVQACEAISRLYPEVIPLITLNKEGVAVFFDSNAKIIKGFEVDVIDTIGAGDAFIAGLAISIAEGNNFLDACNFANASAALSVTEQGAQTAMPNRNNVENFLRTFIKS
ncbi:MAG: ribokinase [Dehalococcoidia bacterium]